MRTTIEFLESPKGSKAISGATGQEIILLLRVNLHQLRDTNFLPLLLRFHMDTSNPLIIILFINLLLFIIHTTSAITVCECIIPVICVYTDPVCTLIA